jgi:hypothetical protein
VALAQQDAEQLEGLGLEGDRLAPAAELTRLLVELVDPEAIDHGSQAARRPPAAGAKKRA